MIASIPAAFARSTSIAARAIARRIVVASDIETAQRCRKQDGGEMRGRQRRHHRHGRA